MIVLDRFVLFILVRVSMFFLFFFWMILMILFSVSMLVSCLVLFIIGVEIRWYLWKI